MNTYPPVGCCWPVLLRPGRGALLLSRRITLSVTAMTARRAAGILLCMSAFVRSRSFITRLARSAAPTTKQALHSGTTPFRKQNDFVCDCFGACNMRRQQNELLLGKITDDTAGQIPFFRVQTQLSTRQHQNFGSPAVPVHSHTRRCPPENPFSFFCFLSRIRPTICRRSSVCRPASNFDKPLIWRYEQKLLPL